MRAAKRLVTVSLCSFERLVMNELLKAEHLSVSFFTDAGEVEAIRDVSFTVEKGEVLAIVGESGCGKSALCKSIMKLLPKTAKIKSGKILVNGADITDYTEKNMSRLRGELFSMVFQDPMTSLNPTITVGKQIGEAVRIHNKKMSRGQIRKRVIELMQLVEIDRPEERIRQYPHEFSGGMRQRAVMAIALAGDPKILFADEPTTALDVTIQAQILDVFRRLPCQPHFLQMSRYSLLESGNLLFNLRQRRCITIRQSLQLLSKCMHHPFHILMDAGTKRFQPFFIYNKHFPLFLGQGIASLPGLDAQLRFKRFDLCFPFLDGILSVKEIPEE